MLYARGYQRTCQDCGYSWQVSRAQARLRPNRRVQRLPRRAFLQGGRYLGPADLAASRGSGDVSNQVLDAVSHCAQCRSTHYTQTPLSAYEAPLD